MRYFLFTVFGLLISPGLIAQTKPKPQSNEAIKAMIQSYKTDIRGPYKDLRWFCADGTTRPPKDPCPETGGVQRARYKDEVVALAQSNHVFLGQILATTPTEDFWDADHQQSRLQQYQIGKYLQETDNGWILRKAQYYRGAFQVEDEQAWGRKFFLSVLGTEDALNKHFYLLRQAIKDIPHQEDNNRTQRIRNTSKLIADEFPAFMDLRIKIHGQPEAADLARVREFRTRYKSELSPALLKSMDELIADMAVFYKPVNLRELEPAIKSLPAQLSIREMLLSYVNDYAGKASSPAEISATAAQLWEIRQALADTRVATARLTLMDLSEKLENILFREASQWEPQTLEASLEKIYALSLAAAGTGLLECW